LFPELLHGLFSILSQDDFIPFLGKFLLVKVKKAKVIIHAENLFHGVLLSGYIKDSPFSFSFRVERKILSGGH
jgi:hypothetical protein